MKSESILIIEDEENARKVLAKALEKTGYDIFQAANGEDGLEIIKQKNISLALCDIKLPGIDGLAVLSEIRKIQPSTAVIMITAFATVEQAVKAIKIGAYDFIEKPLDLQEVRKTVAGALKIVPQFSERKELIKTIKEKNIFEGMIGTSQTMHSMFETIVKVAPTRATVLITGETGTGKEMVARALHNHSNRQGPLVTVNLSALPETLMESELFGSTKNAYTGAIDRKGRLEEADGGTLFLDEAGDIPKNVQVKLLRFLENRTIERLGENISRKVDARIIAATHVDLEKAIADNKFREDLYYRLRVINIDLPALREHPEDIPLLAEIFLKKVCKDNALSVNKISPEAMDLLKGYHWNGNIRQLSSGIERAAIMTEGDTIEVHHLPSKVQDESISGNVISIPIGTSLKEIEKKVIRHTLTYANGNKTKTAEILGIGARTLYRKIDEYEL